MKEQTSLCELEETLLRAGRSERAPGKTRRHVRAAMGLAAGAGIAATAGSAMAAGAGTKTSAGVLSTVVLIKYLAVGAACGALTLSAAKLTITETPGASPASPAPVASAPARRPAAARPARPIGSGAAPEPSSSSPATRAAVPSSAALSAPPDSKAVSLAAELEWLDRARTSLQGGNPSAAHAALDSYAREFPSGQMSLEANVLRIEAIAQSGDKATAARLAGAFERAHPRSPLVARIRHLLPEMNP